MWIVLHSGSRGFGHGVASYYMSQSEEAIPTNEQLARDYIRDYKIAEKYALHNRTVMFKSIILAMNKAIQMHVIGDWNNLINKVHNSLTKDKYAPLYLHRKGATSAERDELGVIPGNMRDGSYIVEGLGNRLALNSCAHGAGRDMSRKKAKKSLDLDVMKKDLDDSAVFTKELTKRDLAESPDAYKDFTRVMELQMGTLFKIKERLYPIINYKG